MYGRCISKLCSAESEEVDMSSNCALARKSAIVVASSTRFPMGVPYSVCLERAQVER